MNKPIITKRERELFWTPSLATARAIDDNDTTLRIEMAYARFHKNMADLESAFEAKASELRASFVREVQEQIATEGE